MLVIYIKLLVFFVLLGHCYFLYLIIFLLLNNNYLWETLVYHPTISALGEVWLDREDTPDHEYI